MENMADVEMNGRSTEKETTEYKKHDLLTTSSVQSVDQYAHKLCLVVIAQLGKDAGFHSIQSSAADTLVDLLIRYLSKVAKSSSAYANLASRTQANFLDVQQSLRDLNVSLEELRNYASFTDNPFLREIPKFPVAKRIELEVTDVTPKSLPSYVPDFLPAFPSAHSYKDTALPSLGASTSSDPKQERKAKTKQKKQLETALANLTAKIGNKPLINYETAKVVASNPFFALTKQTEPGSKANNGEGRSNRLVATPIQKENPFFKTLKPFGETPQQLPSGREHYSEVEEHEREKRRRRAIAILSEQETSMDSAPAPSNIQSINVEKI